MHTWSTLTSALSRRTLSHRSTGSRWRSQLRFAPSTSTVRIGRRIELVGLTAKRATMSWPVEIPPRTPPALFDRNTTRPSSIRISSEFSSPLSVAAEKPAPISTPLTALIVIRPRARSPSSLSYTGSPSPAGTPLATISMIAPADEPALRTPSR